MKQFKVIPAIIPRSFSDLEEKLNTLSFAFELQIDVVDGKFDDDISWPYSPVGEVSSVKSLILNKNIEVDLMVRDPESAGRDWLNAGAKKLVFHIESTIDTESILSLKSEFDCQIGVSIKNDTSIEALYPYINKFDYVQLMGIDEIGSQGQPFDIRVLERVIGLRALYPNLTISVDGAINEENIVELLKAGTDRFVVGSTILKAADRKSKYEELLKIVTG